jgi:hypothetical protein
MAPLEPEPVPVPEPNPTGPIETSDVTANPFYNDFDVSDMFGPSSFDFLFTADPTLGT